MAAPVRGLGDRDDTGDRPVRPHRAQGGLRPHRRLGEVAAAARAATQRPGGCPPGLSALRPDGARVAGGYVLPLKDSVRRAESVELGDTVEVELTVVVG
ncbi:MAG TPA: DUF1905 domain-containing protein [Actinocrinis sp.]|nr:DUF1905 domain-containing protein [Actinocrinis sp.]